MTNHSNYSRKARSLMQRAETARFLVRAFEDLMTGYSDSELSIKCRNENDFHLRSGLFSKPHWNKALAESGEPLAMKLDCREEFRCYAGKLFLGDSDRGFVKTEEVLRKFTGLSCFPTDEEVLSAKFKASQHAINESYWHQILFNRSASRNLRFRYESLTCEEYFGVLNGELPFVLLSYPIREEYELKRTFRFCRGWYLPEEPRYCVDENQCEFTEGTPTETPPQDREDRLTFYATLWERLDSDLVEVESRASLNKSR